MSAIHRTKSFLRSPRVIPYMGSPQIFNLWGERRHKSPNVASDILRDLVAERDVAPFVRNICLADAFLCLLLPNDIRVLFHEKALFLRFLFSLFSLYLPLFYRPTSGRRPREQRHNSPPTKSAVC